MAESRKAVWQICSGRLSCLAAIAICVGIFGPAWFVPTARAGTPCCGVISVEAARGLVTAYELESLNIFTFRVTNRALLSRMKPCQLFSADLAGLKAGQAQAFSIELDTSEPINEARGTVGIDPKSTGRTTAASPCCKISSAPGTAGRVLGSQPHAKFDSVEILLLELTRSEGDLVTATCLYCNLGSARVDLASDLRARVSGAKLLDLANRTEYGVVRTGGPAGEPMVSNHGPGLKLEAQQSARTWMKFNAPQGDKVTLVVPGAAAPFENVPLPRSGALRTSAEPRADRTAPGAERGAPGALPGGGGRAAVRPQVVGPNTSRPVGAVGPPVGAAGLPAGAARVPADARVMALRQHPRAQEVVSAAASKATNPQISISLLAGEDYLISECLGVHASAGSFKTRFENPNVRLEGTGIVVTFRIPRISVDALTIRIRPNPTNPADPCTFGHRFSIGGSIGDIEYEMRYDPILDLKECKLTRPGEFRTRWSIGGLNLKPLQNDLDNAARRMIEAALNGESFIELPDGLLRPHELILRYTIDEVNERLGTNCQPF